MLFAQAKSLLKQTIHTFPFSATIGVHFVEGYLRVRRHHITDLTQTFSLLQRETELGCASLLKLLWEFVKLLESIPNGFGLLEKLYSGGEMPAFNMGYRAYGHGDLLQEKVRKAWQLEERPTVEEQSLMVEFLCNCPNYTLQTLRAWTRPTADKVIRQERVFRLLGSGGKRLLDVGCSVNPWSTEYEKRGYFAVGLDLSYISLRIAGLLHPQDCGRLVCAWSEVLPFADASFDRIVASEVLEHIVVPELAIAEISRLLRSGGIAVVTVPMHVTDVQSMPLEQRRHLLGDATHRAQFFTLSELCKRFEDIGLVVEEVISDPYHILRLRKTSHKVQSLPSPAADYGQRP